MKLSFTSIHKMKPCIFLSVFLLCVLVAGYYDQANDWIPCTGYEYYNLSADTNDLDLQKHRVRYSDAGINCTVLHDVLEVIVNQILVERPATIVSLNILPNAYRAPPQELS